MGLIRNKILQNRILFTHKKFTVSLLLIGLILASYHYKKGRKRPLDTPKRMIERRRERERKVQEEI